VLAQSFRDYEAIVVDDGSQDDTREVVAAFGDRIRLVAQANGGVASARNRGIEQSRGQWIAFLDSDDHWRPDHLELLLAAAEDQPEAHLVYGSKITVDENDVPIPHNEVARFPTGWIFGDLVEDCLITTSTTMALRETLCALNGFDEDPRFMVTQDWDLYFRLAARHPITAARGTHVAYRRLAKSLSHQIVPTVIGNLAALSTAHRLLEEGRVAAENRPEKIDMEDRWRRAYEEAVVDTFTRGHYHTARTLGHQALAHGSLTRPAALRAVLSHLPAYVLEWVRLLGRVPRHLVHAT
jgi:glycosyltransferase involved in cell wall biosynthesis